jgi:predicted  nucleic acid-binding Zn-ribbon protein
MTTDWSEVLPKLLELQRLDLKIARLDQSLSRAPAELKTRRAAIAAIDARARKVEDRMRLLKAQIQLRENDRKAHQTKIDRLKEQASAVRTNKEFVAFRSEIANLQADCDRLDNEVLKILEVVEQAEARLAEYEEERQRESDLAAKAQADVDERLADVRAERDGLLKERPALRKGIPPESLQVYERVHRARGRGMAALEGAYCSACGDVQTRNDVYAVQNRTRPVLCGGCNRILYQP